MIFFFFFHSNLYVALTIFASKVSDADKLIAAIGDSVRCDADDDVIIVHTMVTIMMTMWHHALCACATVSLIEMGKLCKCSRTERPLPI